jgi:hypothetical protein
MASPSSKTLEWIDFLEAPIKRIFPLDNAAHAVEFEQYKEFHRILLETILPETYPGQVE